MPNSLHLIFNGLTVGVALVVVLCNIGLGHHIRLGSRIGGNNKQFFGAYSVMPTITNTKPETAELSIQ